MEYLTFGLSYWVYTTFGFIPAALFFSSSLAVVFYLHKKVLYFDDDLS